MNFNISKEKIDPILESKGFTHSSAGAYVSFEGRVRNHNNGKIVNHLQYEVFHELAYTEGIAVIAEAVKKFELTDVRVIHREGHLEIGDVAVWIGVLSPHRDAAFKGCRYIIDQIKERLPIWKKEFYANEEVAPSWVSCHDHHSIDDTNSYYTKQMKWVGSEGQKKLQDARVLIVGVGGVGCPVATYLTSAGIGTIGLIDGDTVDLTNLHRQTLFNLDDLKKAKVEVAKLKLENLNSEVSVVPYSEFLNDRNFLAITSSFDIIVDCTDNFSAKYLLCDGAYLHHKPLFTASIYSGDGTISFYDHKSGCLRCLWPNSPEQDDVYCLGSCVDSGVLGAQVGVLGSYLALSVINFILSKESSKHLNSCNQIINLDTLQTNFIPKIKDDHCPLCGITPKITSLLSNSIELDSFEIKKSINQKKSIYKFVDIRNMEERSPSALSPLEKVSDHKIWLGQNFACDWLPSQTNEPIVLFCQKGVRSLKAATYLRKKGFSSVYSLRGGYEKGQEIL